MDVVHFICWIVIYPLDSFICPLNSQEQSSPSSYLRTVGISADLLYLSNFCLFKMIEGIIVEAEAEVQGEEGEVQVQEM